MLLLAQDPEADVANIFLERAREEMTNTALQTLFDGSGSKEILQFSEKFHRALFRSKFYQIKDHRDG